MASVRLGDLLDGEHVSQPQSATIFLHTPFFSPASEDRLNTPKTSESSLASHEH